VHGTNANANTNTNAAEANSNTGGGAGAGSGSSAGASNQMLVERWLLPDEGVCFTAVTLFFPTNVTDTITPRTKLDVVVWYGALPFLAANSS
jgi:hypothetical protein